MNLIDITPQSFQCGIGACPAIFKRNDGKYIVIGKEINRSAIADFPQLDGRIGPDEVAIEIPQELLANLTEKYS